MNSRVARTGVTLMLLAGCALAVRAGGARVQSLDGPWLFAVDSTGSYTSSTVIEQATWRTIIVPFSWQAQFGDLRDYQGVAWYRKEVLIEPLDSSETVLLMFGAVDYRADVFVNRKHIQSHEGGYTPFQVEIRKALRSGPNEILVRVVDPVTSGEGTEGIKYGQIPHGKQSWYVQTGGMWQSVAIAVVPTRRILRVHVTPSLNGRCAFDIRLTPGRQDARERLTIRLEAPDGSEAGGVERVLTGVDTALVLETQVRRPLLWSIAEPNLYTFRATLGLNDPVVDRFGFRSIETSKGLLLLNGEPFYLIGALDQDFYPETIYTTPSEEVLRDEMLKAKGIGLNTLRCHIKVPDPRYLKIADEVGMLVWYEIPNWDELTPASGSRAEETLHAMFERDWNHPSLVILSLINESWGIDLCKPDQRKWLASFYQAAKTYAPGRLIVDNSACGGNFHLMTDINDYHTYWAIPENRHNFARTVADVARRPDWLFSPHGDAHQTGNEPLMMSEFGNWGLPNVPDPQPWWINRPFGDVTVAFPGGFDERFTQFKYQLIFDSYASLAEESQRGQGEALKEEIEQLRLSPELQGYVITEFTDINWESNGVLDMWRNVKACGEMLRDLQRQDVIIPRPSKLNYRSTDTAEVRVWISHYSRQDLEGCAVAWSTDRGDRGRIALPPARRAGVIEAEPIRLPLGSGALLRNLRIDLSIKREDGVVLARNFCTIHVYPDSDWTSRPPVRVHSSLRGKEAVFEPTADLSAPLVAGTIDAAALEELKNGGTVICLVDSATRLPTGFPLKITSRASEWYDGNWVSSFSWVRHTRQPFAAMGVGPRMGFEAADVIPGRVIEGIPAEFFEDVLSGMFVGWLHLNSGYLVQMQCGTGKLILTTFPLADQAQMNPYARALLGHLVRYAASSLCAPRYSWKSP